VTNTPSVAFGLESVNSMTAASRTFCYLAHSYTTIHSSCLLIQKAWRLFRVVRMRQEVILRIGRWLDTLDTSLLFNSSTATLSTELESVASGDIAMHPVHDSTALGLFALQAATTGTAHAGGHVPFFVEMCRELASQPQSDFWAFNSYGQLPTTPRFVVVEGLSYTLYYRDHISGQHEDLMSLSTVYDNAFLNSLSLRTARPNVYTYDLYRHSRYIGSFTTRLTVYTRNGECDVRALCIDSIISAAFCIKEVCAMLELCNRLSRLGMSRDDVTMVYSQCLTSQLWWPSTMHHTWESNALVLQDLWNQDIPITAECVPRCMYTHD